MNEFDHPIKIEDQELGSVPELVSFYDSDYFETHYTYLGTDLGAVFEQNALVFRLWSPVSDQAELYLYHAGSAAENKQMEDGSAGGDGYSAPFAVYPMQKKEHGVWEASLDPSFEGVYYTYHVCIAGRWEESADPYAKAAGVNGRRSMALDLRKTDPVGWDQDAFPFRGAGTEAIVWETHVKDFSISENSGMVHKGKYLAFTEEDTCLNLHGAGYKDYPTGLSYLKKLGITHIQLMPLADFATVDESDPAGKGYNWGYDPLNFMVPEGSYATDPFHGEVRIRELKQMIQALHKAGIGVVMDVVYNHTYYTETSWFHRLMPYYYHRTLKDGRIGNASGCGNETASERCMFRLYMLDSLRFWAEEYHIDGFRFDLMGIHDTDTMNEIRFMLDEIGAKMGKTILTYGEPWAALPVAIPEKKRHPLYPADKMHLTKLDGRIRVFDDETRDLIKGSAFKKMEIGYANGAGFLEKLLSDCVKGHPGWTLEGSEKGKSQSVTYVSSHDNYTLWDKLTMTSCKDGSGYDSPEMLRVALNKLCGAFVMTSKGMAFMLSGEEFGRTKYGDGNSYCSPDHVNQLDWERTRTFQEMVAYYRGLIRIRRSFPCFTDATGASTKTIRFQRLSDQVVAYTIRKGPGEDQGYLLIAFNASGEGMEVELSSEECYPDRWNVLAGETSCGIDPLYEIHGHRFFVYTRGVLIASSIEEKENKDK
ncbi:MAG: type I pullulanase [Firmicutes bacterium]|nr:type I pullulanase [Bacillota bacterium]